MTLDMVWTSLRAAWEALPFPILFLYLILLFFVWLGFEYWTTRMGRATPGWRRPLPVLPVISTAAVWGIRICTWLFWAWLVFFLVLTMTILWERVAGGPAFAADVLYSISDIWRNLYAQLVNFVPQAFAAILPGL
jgi:hypothetical protein